ncbi:hypothetical protein [Gryllotalpicola protaetiae]|uniref:Uncharacterized protein n=1 Tax=Gryllotalpicola protaetiae TaxID=2419771 RepID=A0A387BI73_9MICO|nr:hypothetical protein [Gryllotalpicola protaetiae]AYG02388.1 hypothetical protein D7I44_01785 [Gryllotalpicola protaetiae]
MRDPVDVDAIQTEEQASEERLWWITRSALHQAPELILHVRSLAISGRTERGEVLPAWSAPMKLQAMQDADEMFGAVHTWAVYYADLWGEAPPLERWRPYRREGDQVVLGFGAGVTAERARTLLSDYSIWLGVRLDRIRRDEQFGHTFAADATTLFDGLNARYPRAPRPERQQRPRPCPVCGEVEVTAVWRGADQLLVRCGLCGWQPDPKPLARLMQWVLA